MAAFVIASPRAARGSAPAGERLDLFPGAATPTVFAAEEPFWIGYGFVPERENAGPGDRDAFDETTRFELHVDGRSIPMATELRSEGGVPVRKVYVAAFASGLPAGWHDFAGRWYEGGTLVLSSRASIQFVDAVA